MSLEITSLAYLTRNHSGCSVKNNFRGGRNGIKGNRRLTMLVVHKMGLTDDGEKKVESDLGFSLSVCLFVLRQSQ